MRGGKKIIARAFAAAAAVLAAAVLLTGCKSGKTESGSSKSGEEQLFLTAPHRGKIQLEFAPKTSIFRGGMADNFTVEHHKGQVSFCALGDNLIHDGIFTYALNALGGDFNYLYEAVRDYVQSVDIAILNHETMLVADPGQIGGYPAFGTPLGVGDAVFNAGFDVVSCATNHCMDRGGYAANVTRQFYRDRGIACIGIQAYDEPDYIPYWIVERNGLRIAFLNYTYGTNGYPIPDDFPNMVHTLDSEWQVRSDIQAACADSDLQVMCVHMGNEYDFEPNDYQNYWMQVFMEEGVDVVIGSHPHVLQPYGVLQGPNGRQMLVYYSLGNFISCQIPEECKIGGMALFTVSVDGRGVHFNYDRMKTRTVQEGLFYHTILSET